MISLTNVNVSIDRRYILKNISLDFFEREIHLIIGPTGAGKTTLLYAIKGFIPISSGNITSPRSDIVFERERMGLLFQFPEDMFFKETVYEEIAVGPTNFKFKNINELVLSALKKVQLDESYLERSPFNLSYGEKRRVALASILSFQPRWVLMDEPIAGLDWEGIKILKGILLELRDECGIILVAHRYESLINIINRITLIDKGQLIFSNQINSVPWEIIDEIGCEIPYSIKKAMHLRNKGMEFGYPLTIKELVNKIITINKGRTK